MSGWLRFYYFRYIFPYDPTGTWLRHSLKTIIACLLTVPLVLYERNISAVWVFLPTMLFMLFMDTNASLNSRILTLLKMWGLAFITILLMTLISPWAWAKLMLFFIAIFVGAYLSNFGRSQTLLGVVIMLFALFGYRFPVSFSSFPIEIINFLSALLICLLVTLFIWPLRLNKQIYKNIDTGVFLIGRYVCFILSESVRGNYAIKKRFSYQKQMLDINETIQSLYSVYFKKHDEKNLHDLQEAFSRTIDYAVNIGSSISLLTKRSYFFAPLESIDELLKQIKSLYRALAVKRTFDIEVIEKSLYNLEKTFKQQQDLIGQHIQHAQREYSQWNIVFLSLQQFIAQSKLLSDANCMDKTL